ncbi:MAG: PEP-CTERM sorting domain-containing protein [Phycisphaerae bacterium]
MFSKSVHLTLLAAAVMAAAGLVSGGIVAASESIAVGNASFEDNSIASPGYGAITDWASTDTSRSGVNDNTEPFALNTNIPDQSQVGFIQDYFGATAVLSQNITGLNVGQQYWFQVFYNARQTAGSPPAPYTPSMDVTYGSQTLVNVPAVSVASPNYTFLNATFTPTASSGTLSISNSAGTAGDSTLLIDGISIIQRAPNQVVIANPSFEGSGQPSGNGYTYTNAIAGWTATNETGISTGGSSPFANNGTIPDGSKVAYLQVNNAQVTTLSQMIGGLTVGQQYKLSFYYNARNYNSVTPLMQVSLGSTTFTPTGGLNVNPVGGSNPYNFADYSYTATGTSELLSFSNINTAAGSDTSLLLDDVSLQAVPEPATLGLVAVCAIGLLLLKRRKAV